jgi:uncharacterized protein (DUF849 family)
VVPGQVERLKVCLNGGRSRADHPAVPLSPAELAASAVATVAAGAEAVHAHPRNADGIESLAATDIGAAVAAIRQAAPGIPVGVSTGLWIADGDVAMRHNLLAEWAGMPVAARPNFASVNLSEPGWPDVFRLLRQAGIGAEAGIWSVADVGELASDRGDADWLRILVEVPDVPPIQAMAVAHEILRRLDDLSVPAPRLLHGEGASCWPLIAGASTLGLATRIGLEDTLVGPDGSTVSDNAELVEHALRIWSAG